MSNSENADADTSNMNAIAREKNEVPKKDDESKGESEKIVNDNDLWKHRLEENKIARRKESKFFSMESGENVDLEIVEIIGPVEKDFDKDNIPDAIQYEYKIRDLNDLENGVKIWDLSKRWSEALDFVLDQGSRMIRASRVGSGKNSTKYYFAALNVQRNK